MKCRNNGVPPLMEKKASVELRIGIRSQFVQESSIGGHVHRVLKTALSWSQVISRGTLIGWSFLHTANYSSYLHRMFMWLLLHLCFHYLKGTVKQSMW